MKNVYLDNAATTPVRFEAYSAMDHWMISAYGNPSSIHSAGRKARQAIEKARAQVAKFIGAEPQEIYFTSGGTEADNMAIKGVMLGCTGCLSNRILTSNAEHHAVLNSCEWLKHFYIPTTKADYFHDEDLKEYIGYLSFWDGGIRLVSWMAANNEIPKKADIKRRAAIAHQYGALFHCDYTQIAAHEPIDVKKDDVDLATISSHKIEGPKGVGALYIRKGVEIVPLFSGGSQEGGIRPGTENVAGIVGFGAAAQAWSETDWSVLHEEQVYWERRIREAISKVCPTVKFNRVEQKYATYGTVSAVFPGYEAQALVMQLSNYSIQVSAGAACNSGSLQPSHVLIAYGLSKADARSTIRFSFNAAMMDQGSIEQLSEALETVLKV